MCKDGGCETTEDTLVIGDGVGDFELASLEAMRGSIAKDAIIILSAHGSRQDYKGEKIHALSAGSGEAFPTSSILQAISVTLGKDSKATVFVNACYSGLAVKEFARNVMPRGITLIGNSDANTTEMDLLSIRKFDAIRGVDSERAKSMLLRMYPEGFSYRKNDKLYKSNPPKTLLDTESARSHIRDEFKSLNIPHRGPITDEMVQQYNVGLICSCSNLDLSEEFLASVSKSGMDVNSPNLLGIKPVRYAAYSKNIPLIRALMFAGAEVDADLFNSVVKLMPDK